MSASSINKAVDVVGEVVPQAVRPIAVETFNSRDYQTVMDAGLINFDFNYFTRTLTTATKETYEYYFGGTFDGTTYTGGSVVGTIVINYTDSTLATVASSGRVS